MTPVLISSVPVFKINVTKHCKAFIDYYTGKDKQMTLVYRREQVVMCIRRIPHNAIY